LFIAAPEPPLQCCHPCGNPAQGTKRSCSGQPKRVGVKRGMKGKVLQVEVGKKLLERETFTPIKCQKPLFLGQCK